MEKRAVLTKRSAEETKPIPAIYDEEASAASAEPSTSGYFPLFRRVRAAMYGHRAKRFPKLPNHRRDLQIPVPKIAGIILQSGTNPNLCAALRGQGYITLSVEPLFLSKSNENHKICTITLMQYLLVHRK
ncbi:hypothetical protein T03_14725 [Trichinella britovi]|uniref:Uncharacterized protein n=1 Tax=Trichinella britovi TaxID=45882 RepID=A0A0V1CEV1_TRIBR|nr:hypothetical protein T03_14725 [Trichinella britovi]